MKCPNCGGQLEKWALTDSDDRVYYRFRGCSNCDYRTDMGRAPPSSRQLLGRLADFCVEDILAMSDEEILAEAAETP